jgi:hypothetical protein
MADPQIKALGTVLSQARAYGLGVTLQANQARIKATVHCADETNAQQLSAGLQSLWDKQVKPMAALAALGPMKPLIDDLLKNTDISSQGAKAQFSILFGPESINLIAQQIQQGNAQGNFQQAGPGAGMPQGFPQGGAGPGGGRMRRGGRGPGG